MKISLATALSLTALAGSAQANWFHKDPKRQSAFPRSWINIPPPPFSDMLPCLFTADYTNWDLDTLSSYLKEKNFKVPDAPSRDELFVPLSLPPWPIDSTSSSADSLTPFFFLFALAYAAALAQDRARKPRVRRWTSLLWTSSWRCSGCLRGPVREGL